MIRDAVAADLPAVVDIYNASIPGRMATADLAPVSVADRQAWFAEFDPGRRPLWIYGSADDAQVLGWLSLRSFYGRPAYAETVEVGIYTAPCGPAARRRAATPRPCDRTRPGSRHFDAAGVHLRPQRAERRPVPVGRLPDVGRVAAGCAPRRRDEGPADTRASVVIAQHETIHSSNGRSFRIASATPADVPDLHALIAGLADYERLTDICVATQHDLEQALFGEVRCAEALIARVDANHQEAAGFALFFHTYSTFLGRRSLWLEDLLSGPNTVAAAWGGSFSKRSLHWRWSGSAVASNGRCSTGTRRRSTSTNRSVRRCCPIGGSRGSRAMRCRDSLRAAGRLQPTLGIRMPDQSLLDVAAAADGLDADFWSLRFVEETCESFSVQRNVAAAVGRIDRPRRHGVRLCRWRLWLCRHRRHVAAGIAQRAAASAGVGTRYRPPRPDRFTDAAATGTPRTVRITVVRPAVAVTQ